MPMLFANSVLYNRNPRMFCVLVPPFCAGGTGDRTSAGVPISLMAPRFFIGPARWLRPESPLTSSERLVLAVLCLFTNKQGGDCWPSVATIASHAHLAESTVHAALKGLKNHGVIRIRKRKKADGSPDSNLFIVMGFDPTSEELEDEVVRLPQGVVRLSEGGGPINRVGVVRLSDPNVVKNVPMNGNRIPRGFMKNPNGNGLIRLPE